MPSLERLHQRYKGKNFSVIAIDLQESKDTVLKFVLKNRLSYVNLLDTDGQVSAVYGVRSTPMKILIGKDGNLVAAALGYRDWDKDEFIQLIDILVNE